MPVANCMTLPNPARLRLRRKAWLKIQTHYRIEKDLCGLSADHCHAVREARSKPIIDAFTLWQAQSRARVSRITNRRSPEVYGVYSGW
ncbi:hypothetical protein, partial [Tritonibacter mobilis]|uniref:hypothetical protein n=1 Tax=Tritonibacter mobilis TaxID=379347 RepID=UPI0019525317